MDVGVNPGIMTIVGEGARVDVDDCIIYNNNYGDISVSPVGYAIQVSNGGDLVYKNSCIIGNLFTGAGPVILEEGSKFVLVGSYADMPATALVCTNVARFRKEEERVNLLAQCVNTQAETCRSSLFRRL